LRDAFRCHDAVLVLEPIMANRDIVAIGTSAGGVQALLYLSMHLPADFPACILVTIHLPSDFRSSLDEILARAGSLPASFAQNGDRPKERHIYIAPPGHHMLMEDSRIILGQGPLENNVRPAIDPMLRSVAVCCGSRSVGVVLTGTLGDGASGLRAITRCGGIAVVQDPLDAAFPEMPLKALNRSMPQHVVFLEDMPGLLQQLVRQAAGEPMPVPESIKFEVEVAKSGRSSMREMDQIGRRSVLTCPECNGVMWEIDEGDLVRYRCHVGHAYTAEVMNLGLEENIRRALSTALRTLEERVALTEKLRSRASDQGHNRVTEHWARKKEEAEKEAEIIRAAIRRAEDIPAAAENQDVA
jgi:two-component system chemotaxis response regulator CheB